MPSGRCGGEGQAPLRSRAFVSQGRTHCDADASANGEADADAQGQVAKRNPETGAKGQAKCRAPCDATTKMVFADLALLFIHSASP